VQKKRKAKLWLFPATRGCKGSAFPSNKKSYKTSPSAFATEQKPSPLPQRPFLGSDPFGSPQALDTVTTQKGL